MTSLANLRKGATSCTLLEIPPGLKNILSKIKTSEDLFPVLKPEKKKKVLFRLFKIYNQQTKKPITKNLEIYKKTHTHTTLNPYAIYYVQID